MNQELPDVQAGFRKGRGIISNCQHPLDHRKSKRIPKKKTCFIDYAKAFDCVEHSKLWKILERCEYQTTLPDSWETCMQVKKQQLKVDTEQWTGSTYWEMTTSKLWDVTLLLELLCTLLLLLSRFSRVRLCATPQMAAHQAPPSLGFSRQEYWSGLPFPSLMHEKWKWSCSVVSDSLRPQGLQPTRLLCPWDFPGKSAGVGCQCLLLYAHYFLKNAGLDETQARIKIARRYINNLRYTDDTTLMGESEEKLKSLLMKVKEESEEAGLKLNIQKTKITASSPITS